METRTDGGWWEDGDGKVYNINWHPADNSLGLDGMVWDCGIRFRVVVAWSVMDDCGSVCYCFCE